MICDKVDLYFRGELTKADPAALDTAAAFFRRSLEWNLTAQPEAERRHLSASSPMYCSRRVLYGLRGAQKVEQNPRSRLAFTMGDTVEQMGVLLTRLAGVDVLSPGPDGKQEEVEVIVAGEKITGHLDMVVRGSAGERIPTDFKSMAEYGFDEFKAACADPQHKWHAEERWGYVGQLMFYMKALDAPFGLMIGVNKNTGHMAEMQIPFDPKWWKEYEDRIRFVVANRDSGATPSRPPWAVTEVKNGKNLRADGSEGPVEEVKHWRCNYCPFVGTCFDGFALVPLKAKPAWRKAVSAQTPVQGVR